MPVEYSIPAKHSLKILWKLNIFYGDIKKDVSVCFFPNTL